MNCYLIVAALALAGQTGGGTERYPPPRSGQASGANSANSGAVNSAASSATGSGTNGSSTPASGSSPYLNSPPPGFGTPVAPKSDASRQPESGNQLQSLPLDSQRQPAFPAENSAAAPQSGAGLKPSEMMQAMLSPPRDSQLRGESTRLVDVLLGARSRSEQTQRVEAYWDLCSAVADYYLGLREQEELRRLGSMVSRPGAAMQEADKKLTARVGTSQRAARVSQLRLANMMGRGSSSLPLPADIPHCGSYTTYYEKIFSGRNSPEAQELAALLPQRYAELKDAAAAVTRAEEWLDNVASARSENSDGTGSVKASELLALCRRAFVQIARDYNRRIARYAELAMPGQISAERLAGMLIKRPASSTATRSGTPASGSGRQSTSAESGPPRTFVENWSPSSNATARSSGVKRDDEVQRASAEQSEPRRERSLLVPTR